ncbi:helix-turn-helix transcriptional regulator [Paucibacter sp. APW11]|uniref:Helix-turn-helix transcriptional regulator n=1 Tax=Roseateles aquae TaxID=3077235 RepID=A0ABU3PC87_9BURK|nr:helix-turn-helix transcriptional regulator [Paucibacter sp. APW11]MDT8999952.1 helix-turn-helix transcriptional regulator [Paucibacter sp. APW11]
MYGTINEALDATQPGFTAAPEIRSAAPGRVFLVSSVLKDLRQAKLQSQEDMAEACAEGRFRVSIASIKRAETGKPVLFRIARELARYFNVPVEKIVAAKPAAVFEAPVLPASLPLHKAGH